jgi:hypothetical protein
MLEMPCEVLIRKNAEIEWAENQIRERAESMEKAYNVKIMRGYPPYLAREEYMQEMAKVCDHFLPVYRGAVPRFTITRTIEA